MKILYVQPNGVLAIAIPNPEFLAKFTEEAEAVAAVVAKMVPDGLPYRFVGDEESFPEDRTFRDAWTMELTVDMDKARTIHMDCIRTARNKELQRLDIETMRGVDVQEAKQVLRDLPQTFDLSKAETPDDLKALWPKELPTR